MLTPAPGLAVSLPRSPARAPALAGPPFSLPLACDRRWASSCFLKTHIWLGKKSRKEVGDPTGSEGREGGLVGRGHQEKGHKKGGRFREPAVSQLLCALPRGPRAPELQPQANCMLPRRLCVPSHPHHLALSH